jgi:signal transduction histidine kinase
VLAERTRIARDMHDGLLQDLTGIALQLRALLPHVRAAPETAALASILELTERTGQEARRAVLGMRTRASVDATLADLVHAVETAAQRAAAHGSAALSVTVKGRARPVHADVCDAVAAIVHEAVTNARRHAGARTVKLSLVFQRARLRLAVSDDGRGFPLPGDDEAGHYGLVGMRERATGLGASFNLRSRPGAGTTIRLDVPYGR